MSPDLTFEVNLECKTVCYYLRCYLVWTNCDESVSPDGSDVDFVPSGVEADHLKVFAQQTNSFTQIQNFAFFVHFLLVNFNDF
jgi:hypothetical protein